MTVYRRLPANGLTYNFRNLIWLVLESFQFIMAPGIFPALIVCVDLGSCSMNPGLASEKTQAFKKNTGKPSKKTRACLQKKLKPSKKTRPPKHPATHLRLQPLSKTLLQQPCAPNRCPKHFYNNLVRPTVVQNTPRTTLRLQPWAKTLLEQL